MQARAELKTGLGWEYSHDTPQRRRQSILTGTGPSADNEAIPQAGWNTPDPG